MKFLLFSKIPFEVSHPIALIESYCFQSDFYANYDHPLRNRKVSDVNIIGARIKKELLPKCEVVSENTKNLRIFKYPLDRFLELNDRTISNHIKDLNEEVIRKLLNIEGIGLSKATKVLHTLYPEIIPMIDKALQEEYRKEINPQWKEELPNQIFIDYYKNLREDCNKQHLSQIHSAMSRNNLTGLTKVRIFDILWWSYLKAKRLSEVHSIDWSTMR